jgi:hypothetical protein
MGNGLFYSSHPLLLLALKGTSKNPPSQGPWTSIQ